VVVIFSKHSVLNMEILWKSVKDNPVDIIKFAPTFVNADFM